MYRSILRRFPEGIEYGFAYGSAVKPQLGYDRRPNISRMIDFIFCVKDPHAWHHMNLERNENHYSLLRVFGSKFISDYQKSFGAGLYFNTLVPCIEEGVYIKYGVISRENLLEDLLSWNYLYTSGRLHKPVQIVVPTENIAIKKALEENLKSSLRAALLILPSKFTDFELFYTISNLSYAGDFRMIFGENKQKVYNIVTPQLEEFYKYYIPALHSLSDNVALIKDSSGCRTFEQEKSVNCNENLMRYLPSYLLKRIIILSGTREKETKAIQRIATRRDMADLILRSVKQIVQYSSIVQSIKNIPSAGIGKSLIYSSKKIMKMFNK